MDAVGDNNLLVSDVTAVFGHYIKYYVKCYSTQTVKPRVNVFEIMLSAHITYAPRSCVGNLHWIWHSKATDIDSALQSSQPLIERLKEDISQYHMRAMKRVMYEKFGPVTPSVKKSVLRHLYKDLVGDCSASVNLSESEIDERVAALFELEEPSLVYDLCDHFSGRQSKFDVF